MNNDVVFEILLHLPLLSLLRFIAVYKFWYYVIDSPHFRKLHTLRRNNNKNEEVYLQFTFCPDYSLFRKKVSINLLDNGTSSKSHDFWPIGLRVSGSVKGLVCLTSPHTLDIAICNPFLGQFKILPRSPYSSTHSYTELYNYHNVGLGFDEDYKVVQLQGLHANLYSARTNSWRELDVDQDLVIQRPIKSLCKNGSFVHWEGYRTNIWCTKIILSFDMKNEVFRTITISGDRVLDRSRDIFAILAKGECSFVIIISNGWKLNIYESSGEGSELMNNVNSVTQLSIRSSNIERIGGIPIRRNDDCVLLRRSKEMILYDYRARKFIERFKICRSSVSDDDIIEYEGSLLSP